MQILQLSPQFSAPFSLSSPLPSTLPGRCKQGVNKAVILSLVDELLARKEVNIWWLPDNIERMLYFNVSG